MSVAEQTLLMMIHSNLEQAVELMEIGQPELARAHVEEVTTQFQQVDEVRAQEAARPKPKQLTITL